MEETKKAKDGGSEIASLKAIIADLAGKVDSMSANKSSGVTLRKRTREHNAFLREVELDGEIVGVASRLHSVREVKDPTENKKFYGLCIVEWVDPLTGKTGTAKDVNYLDFLQSAPIVSARIIGHQRTSRIETEIKKGGGGRGTLRRQEADREIIIDNDYQFEVEFIDDVYELEVQDGKFEGATFKNDGRGLNIF